MGPKARLLKPFYYNIWLHYRLDKEDVCRAWRSAVHLIYAKKQKNPDGIK
jgi:hypothetical protein